MWELRGGPLTSRALRTACDEASPTVLQARLTELREAGFVELGEGGGYGLTALGQDLCEMVMNAPSSSSRQIVWPSVITVISAAILIGAEVFGAAFAGGWALAILFGLGDQGAHILQAVLFALGVLVMTAFIRAAQRIEPFTKRG